MERVFILLAICAAAVFAAPINDRATWKRYAVALPSFGPVERALPQTLKSPNPWSN
jgi:hypothetical protein